MSYFFEVVGAFTVAVTVMPFDERQALKRIVKKVVRNLYAAKDAERINQASGPQNLEGEPGIRQRHIVKLQSVFTDFQKPGSNV